MRFREWDRFIIKYLGSGLCAFGRWCACIVELESGNSRKNQDQHSYLELNTLGYDISTSVQSFQAGHGQYQDDHSIRVVLAYERRYRPSKIGNWTGELLSNTNNVILTLETLGTSMSTGERTLSFPGVTTGLSSNSMTL